MTKTTTTTNTKASNENVNEEVAAADLAKQQAELEAAKDARTEAEAAETARRQRIDARRETHTQPKADKVSAETLADCSTMLQHLQATDPTELLKRWQTSHNGSAFKYAGIFVSFHTDEYIIEPDEKFPAGKRISFKNLDPILFVDGIVEAMQEILKKQLVKDMGPKMAILDDDVLRSDAWLEFCYETLADDNNPQGVNHEIKKPKKARKRAAAVKLLGY